MCQSCLHTASESFFCHKKIPIRFAFLRFSISRKYFNRKRWWIWKNPYESLRLSVQGALLLFGEISGAQSSHFNRIDCTSLYWNDWIPLSIFRREIYKVKTVNWRSQYSQRCISNLIWIWCFFFEVAMFLFRFFVCQLCLLGLYVTSNVVKVQFNESRHGGV